MRCGIIFTRSVFCFVLKWLTNFKEVYTKGKTIMNKENKIKVMTTAILVALMLSSTTASASGAVIEDRAAIVNEEEYFNGVRTVKEKYLSSVKNKNTWNYSRFDVTIRGKSVSVKGFTMNSVDYIPFRASASALGLSYSYDSKNKTALMYGSGLALSATENCYSIYGNERPLFSSSPVVIMSDGRMYIPVESFAKATGLTISKSDSSLNLSGTYKALTPADKFYREDEILWLARIIYAESSGEPLLGKIAVGNVVLNRVKSTSYPNTIYGVIFDRKYGVQFSPILNGTIYNTPDYQSILAAKICLEGFDISEGALFFLHPEISTSSWIPNSRPYLFSIGNHDFYK